MVNFCGVSIPRRASTCAMAGGTCPERASVWRIVGSDHGCAPPLVVTVYLTKSGVPNTNTELWPPKPKELLKVMFISCERASLGV